MGALSAKYDDSFVRLILGDDYVNMTNDNIEKAVAAVLGVDGRNELRFLMKAMKTQFSLRQFKQELARIEGVEPKDFRHADSLLRRTLKRRGYTVSGKPGRPKKSPRLPTE